MRRISILLLLLVVCSATAIQAQAQAPKPDPEVKKLHVLVGRWTFDGEVKPGPLGPGGRFTGECNCRMILGGFFLQCQVSGKTPAGETHGLEIDGYDPVNRNFSNEFYIDDGGKISAALNITGNTWTHAGKLATAGKQYQYRATFEAAPDLANWTYKDRFSPDGKTWTPFLDLKYTKAPPLAKK